MAAVPSLGRAAGAEQPIEREAELTRALYEEYSAQIFRYCLHQLGSREEAEDAVQSTFLNAFRGIKRGVVPELQSAWLFKIAHNVCLSRRRSAWRRGKIEAPTDFDVVAELAPAPSRRADELIGLQEVLEQMPEQQRRAILLREWQGLSYREIGDELELSQAAVETLIFRARRSLAQGLEQPRAGQKRRRRLGAGLLGNLVSSAQSCFVGGGAAAVKVAATVAVVSAGTVVATAPVRHQPKPHRPKAAARAVPAASRPAPAPVERPAAPAVDAAPPAPRVVPRRRRPVAPAAAAARRIGPAATPVLEAAPPVAAPPVTAAPPVEPVPQPAPAAATRPDAPAGPPAAAPTSPWRHGRTNGPAEPAGAVPETSPWAGHGRHDRGNASPADAPPAGETVPADTAPTDATATTPTTSTTPTSGDTTGSAPGRQNDQQQQTAPSPDGSRVDNGNGD